MMHTGPEPHRHRHPTHPPRRRRGADVRAAREGKCAGCARMMERMMTRAMRVEADNTLMRKVLADIVRQAEADLLERGTASSPTLTAIRAWAEDALLEPQR